MRQGISTRYLGPTNSRGSRIKALARKRDGWGAELSHVRPWQYVGSVAKEHTMAAKELATKLEWSGLWIGGGNPENNGYQYVFAGDPGKGYAQTYMVSPLTEDEDWFFVPAK